MVFFFVSEHFLECGKFKFYLRYLEELSGRQGHYFERGFGIRIHTSYIILLYSDIELAKHLVGEAGKCLL